MTIDGIPVTGPSMSFSQKDIIIGLGFQGVDILSDGLQSIAWELGENTRVFCFQATINGWRLYVADIKVVSIQICLLIFDA